MNPPIPAFPTADPKPGSSPSLATSPTLGVRRASELMSCDVRDKQGEKLASIEDLIVDERAGHVAAAVLAFGGILGFGEKRFAVPLARLTRSSDPHVVVTDLGKGELENAPSFPSGAWPQFDRKYTDSLNVHYRVTRPGTRATSVASVGPVGDAELDPERLHARGLERASKLIGTTVTDPSGASVGHLADLAVEEGSDRIVYAVLSFGGFLGMGDKLFALPWSALSQTYVEEKLRLVLDVAKERLEAAPGFDKTSWPNLADRRWGARVHEYYAQEPWWAASNDRRPDSQRPI
ncbi:MAG: PRC-barrel domain-containing protein [Planctomycetes bacterium]|nr:PRC-barrel domain-containing protein [Planctomycetota bacterium]